MNSSRIHLIACGVLAVDIQRLSERHNLDFSAEYLPGGLHNDPAELRRRLQAAIDDADATGHYDRIAVGYGVCGRGTVGIQARNTPLVIPQVQDCIALFLGSDQAYRAQFARYPGTYYISAGWYDGKIEPASQDQCGSAQSPRDVDDKDAEQLRAKYGAENGQAILDFLNSWQRNYQRAAFIDTGAPQKQKYARYAQAMAEEFGWQYEALPGKLDLLEQLLAADHSTDEILVAPPGHVIVHDAVAGRLKAVPTAQRHSRGRRSQRFVRPGAAAEGPADAFKLRLGLGIDAGGTYTDVVLYDFAAQSVLAKGKALTTKWDFTQGIAAALADLPDDELAQVQLVSLSTTLATNAIVEGHGQKVALLVMPPNGRFEPGDFPHQPTVAVPGQLAISGREVQPVGADQVRRLARRLVETEDVRAFAVSGYAATINPPHEQQVRDLVRSETGLGVTCGHELSQLLNFKTRALTAVLNARIIPRLDRLIRDVQSTLTARKIAAPMVVVKGDGSLMAAEAARVRPVETILSGPAASLAGARYLTGLDNALVVDMGGTTTDTAMLRNGVVKTDDEGTRVGGRQTHVRALAMRTIGLGGDSAIIYADGKFRIGPQRVTPFCALAAQNPAGAMGVLDHLSLRLDDFAASTEAMQMLYLTGHAADFAPTVGEKAVLDALAKHPHSLAELGRLAEFGLWSQLRTDRLEEHYVVQRVGLTPTDLLHVQGDFVRWDRAAAERLLALVAEIARRRPEDMAAELLDQIRRLLAVELLKKQLDEAVASERLDDCEVCRHLINAWLNGAGEGFEVRIKLRHPVIGIGAPVHFFLPAAAHVFDTEAIVPEHADVANAIGAITSNVLVRHELHVRPDELGGFVVEGLADAPRYARLHEAADHAMAALERLVRASARQLGTSETLVTIDSHDRISATSEGQEVFLGRQLVAQLSGRPDRIEA